MLNDEMEKIVRRCAYLAAHACLVPPDGGSPTEEEVAVCDRARDRILEEFGLPPKN